jgi:hypothetical protein
MTVHLGQRQTTIRQGAGWLLIMVAALVAFELFNFSTTEYALGTFFAGHTALGMASWATVLSIAFCGLDFAGLSRLFTQSADWRKEPKEIWLLTLAWLLGAAMNAAMTWWAVTTALTENAFLGNELVSREQIIRIVPVAVAILVWLTRVTLIGSIATSGDHFINRALSASGTGKQSTPAFTDKRPDQLSSSHPFPLPESSSTPRYSASASSGAQRASRRASSTRSYSSQQSLRYDRPRASEPVSRVQANTRTATKSSANSTSVPGQRELTYVDLD